MADKGQYLVLNLRNTEKKSNFGGQYMTKRVFLEIGYLDLAFAANKSQGIALRAPL